MEEGPNNKSKEFFSSLHLFKIVDDIFDDEFEEKELEAVKIMDGLFLEDHSNESNR